MKKSKAVEIIEEQIESNNNTIEWNNDRVTKWKADIDKLETENMVRQKQNEELIVALEKLKRE